MKINTYMNNSARKIIKSFIDYSTECKTLIEDWLRENIVKCYILNENNTDKCFVLLSKRDNDPLNKHKNPYIFHLIYTFKPYRKYGLASLLLSHVKQKDEITIFAYNNSSNLFSKNGFILIEYNNCSTPTFRYP